MNLERSLWMVFIIALSLDVCRAQALQCYVCDDCGDPNDLTELQICGAIGTPVVTTRPPVIVSSASPSAELVTSTASSIDSAASSSATQVTSASDLVTSNAADASTNAGPNTSIISSTAVNTNNIAGSTSSTASSSAVTTSGTTSRAPLPTTQATQPTEDEYEDYQEYDYNSRGFQPKQEVIPRLQESVCYILKWRKNNSIGTSRGCATMVDLNKTQACLSLYDGRPLEDCLICTSNGCNKREEEIPYDPWQENQINSATWVLSHGFGISAIVAAHFIRLLLS